MRTYEFLDEIGDFLAQAHFVGDEQFAFAIPLGTAAELRARMFAAWKAFAAGEASVDAILDKFGAAWGFGQEDREDFQVLIDEMVLPAREHAQLAPRGPPFRATLLSWSTPLAYDVEALFIETPVFTRRVQEHLSEEDYRALQLVLSSRPDRGSLIPGGGGLRKIRWRRGGTGKRGGVRVIYYWSPPATNYMLFIYRKPRDRNLSRKQLMTLAAIVREELK